MSAQYGGAPLKGGAGVMLIGVRMRLPCTMRSSEKFSADVQTLAVSVLCVSL